MKKSGKTDRQMPISLVPRRHHRGLPDVSPHRTQLDVGALRPIDTNRQNTSMNNTLKREMQAVKQDVEKLFREESIENHDQTELQTLRDKVYFYSQVEEQLRKELRQAKSKIERMDEVREDRYKFEREKEIASDRINRLQQELLEATKTNKIKEDAKLLKIQTLTKDLEKCQHERNIFEDESNKLSEIVKIYTKPKQDGEMQCNQDQVLQIRRKMHEVQKEKLTMAGKLKEKETQLRRLYEETQTMVKEKDAKYNNCLNQFKVLEAKLSKYRQEAVNVLKSRLQESESNIFTLKQSNDTLKAQNTELLNRIDRIKHQLQQQKRINEDIIAKMRSHQNQSTLNHIKQVSDLQKKSIEMQTVIDTLSMQLQSKSKQLEDRKEKSRSTIQHPSVEQLHRVKLQLLNLQGQVNQQNNTIHKMKDQIQASNELHNHKDIYIAELEKQNKLQDKNETVQKLEKKCLELCEEHNKMAEQYERRIIVLESENSKKKQHIELLSRDTDRGGAPSHFDDILKMQITETEHLKQALKLKSEETLNLKGQIEEWRRKAETLKSQTEIDKLRGMTQEKTLKSHYEITIQNMKSDIESQKRKFEGLQRKVQFKTEQLKKKDEFIQQVIIGKSSKPNDVTEIQYMRKQLQKFFAFNYESRILEAEETVRQLQSKLKQ